MTPKMNILQLPQDVLYLFLSEAASFSPSTLSALARTARPIFSVYSNHKTALLRTALVNLTGQTAFPWSLEYARRGHTDHDDDEEAIVHRALSNHSQISRFTRYIHLHNALRNYCTEGYIPWTGGPMPVPSRLLLDAVYDYAAHGFQQSDTDIVSNYFTLPYGTRMVESPIDPETRDEARQAMVATMGFLLRKIWQQYWRKYLYTKPEQYSVGPDQVYTILAKPGAFSAAYYIFDVEDNSWEELELELTSPKLCRWVSPRKNYLGLGGLYGYLFWYEKVEALRTWFTLSTPVEWSGWLLATAPPERCLELANGKFRKYGRRKADDS